MIENKDEPAFPVEVAFSGDVIRGHQTGSYSGWATGLTKREYFAAMAMQGICANPEFAGTREANVASMALAQADALLAALKTTVTQ